jgi:hypothetical protein
MLSPALIPLLTSLPGRYAHGFYKSLKPAECTPALKRLEALAAYFDAHPPHRAMLIAASRRPCKNPEFPHVLWELSGGLKPVANLLQVLLDNNRLPMLTALSRLLAHLINHNQGSRVVQVKTAQALSADQQRDVEKRLTGFLQAKVHGVFAVDPTLLAGFQAQIDNTLIEASLQGYIEQTRRVLKGEI